MADSIRELIIKNVVTVLKTITKTNGYNIGVQKVERLNLTEHEIKTYPTIVVIPSDETELEEPTDRETMEMNMSLLCILKDYLEITEKTNIILADIKKALLLDCKRGGYAMDTKMLNNAPFYNAFNKPYGGIEINIKIKYRHKFGDPYTLG